MKKVIRYGVFETNSSTSHAITIFTKEEYERFKTDKTLLASNFGGDKLYTEKELKEIALEDWNKYGNAYSDNFEDFFEDWLLDGGYCTYEDFFGCLEADETEYTSPSGDELVMICRYGYAG